MPTEAPTPVPTACQDTNNQCLVYVELLPEFCASFDTYEECSFSCGRCPTKPDVNSTKSSSESPTVLPTQVPTNAMTTTPTFEPSKAPTSAYPTAVPTVSPSEVPTVVPTIVNVRQTTTVPNNSDCLASKNSSTNNSECSTSNNSI